MYSFSFDAAAGILCIKVMGSWTLPEVERYAREAGLQFPRARQSAGQLRLLIDPQSSYVTNGTAAMNRAKDDEIIAAFFGAAFFAAVFFTAFLAADFLAAVFFAGFLVVALAMFHVPLEYVAAPDLSACIT